MYFLHVLGGLSLTTAAEPVTGRATQRRRLALLTILATSRAQAVSRDKLLGLLWPDIDGDRARHLLSDSVYILREALGDDALILAGGTVALNPDRVTSEVTEFTTALSRGDSEAAVEAFSGKGVFLDGFYLSDAPDFERWVDTTRAQLTAEYRRVLEQLAAEASAQGRHTDAVQWWRRLALDDRLSSRVALGLMRALASTGDLAAAVEFAREHEQTVRAELECAPDPDVTAFVASLRATPLLRPPASRRERHTEVGSGAETSPKSVALPTVTPTRHHSFGFAAVALVVMAAVLWAARSGAKPDTSSAALNRARLETHNPAAYDLYLRGRQQRETREIPAFRAAVGYFQRAIAADSTFAAAYAGLADAYAILGVNADYAAEPSRTTALAAEAAALKAVALDDSLADAHFALAFVRMISPMDFGAAEAHLRRGLALDPKSRNGHRNLAMLYAWTERADQSVREARLAMDLDPMSVSEVREYARALFAARRYDEALVQIERSRSLGPHLYMAPLIAGEIFATERKFPQAIAAFRSYHFPQGFALLGYTFGRSGERAQAKAILDTLIARWERGSGGAYDVAIVYAGLGKFDESFVWLDRALEDYSIRPTIMEPLFDDLRGDARFDRIRRRMGVRPLGEMPDTSP